VGVVVAANRFLQIKESLPHQVLKGGARRADTTGSQPNLPTLSVGHGKNPLREWRVFLLYF